MQIFISYRRSDDAGHARALFHELEKHVTPGSVFWDVEAGITPGTSFTEVLQRRLEGCSVLLVVIGRNWLTELRAQSRTVDYVVQEISAGFGLCKRVIPVLVGGGRMPEAAGLPAEIQRLAELQAVTLRPEAFRQDCVLLLDVLHEGNEPVADGMRHGEDEYGKTLTVTVGGQAMLFRHIPAGRFLMGAPANERGRLSNEPPQREVEIAQPFYMAEVPCYQAFWEAVMGENPSRFRGARRPVESVSFGDCQRFLEALGRRVRGLRPRLPTEAEWEYACRAGGEGLNDVQDLDEMAWHRGNSGGGTQDVGGKRGNGWGLRDMMGNVWEWTGGSGELGVCGVVRGGCWRSVAADLRIGMRALPGIAVRSERVGLRLALAGRC